MAIIIKLQEKNNKLLFADLPVDICCGNSNYQFDIDFDEDWKNFSTKTAVFSINCKNQLVDFSGSIVNVPCLPNAQSMNFYVMCSDEKLGSRVTNSLSINLIPTKNGLTNEGFENARNYLAELRALLSEIENGTYVVSTAKKSLTQVSLTGNETVSGTKNFVGALQKNGVEVATVSNISNPSLLINGNFKVNQRGESTYSTAGRYTVDRWKLVNGSVSVASNGIILNGTISQTLEHTPTETVTQSVDNSAGGVSCSYLNGVFKITATNKLVKWAKLEVGTTPTPFSPRIYAEELALCQRFYQKINVMNRGNSQYSEIAFGYLLSNSISIININLPQGLRTIPTLQISSLDHFNIRSGVSEFLIPTKVELYASNISGVIIKFHQTYSENYGVCALRPNDTAEGFIILDAEMY